MSVRLTILGSGSSGNCAYLETDETRVLIDAGFSLRLLVQALRVINQRSNAATSCWRPMKRTYSGSGRLEGRGRSAISASAAFRTATDSRRT